MAKRVSFLVDGFNLYHSVKDAHSDGAAKAKWLDVRAFCASYLYHFGREATLEGVYYFSALATHLVQKNPGVVQRHQVFISALKHTGVQVEMGRFKKKNIRCHTCRKDLGRHEEKETDVAIAVRLVELALTDRTDAVAILTGDTDIAPALRTVRRLRPEMSVCVVLPYKRVNAELQQIAHQCFKVGRDRYEKFLLPATIDLPSGRQITKPLAW